ncbi:MAG: hypothetical protein ACRD0K_11950 [Egibacteraceae bacterium]
MTAATVSSIRATSPHSSGGIAQPGVCLTEPELSALVHPGDPVQEFDDAPRVRIRLVERAGQQRPGQCALLTVHTRREP